MHLEHRPFLTSLPLLLILLLLQVKNLTLKIEQETQKRYLVHNDLKAQNQQLSSLRASEKQLKQEINHLLDIKSSLEKQNQELRRCGSALLAMVFQMNFKKTKTMLFLVHRERQDSDGQMKELQDQFEAEQYFSVSFCLCSALGKRLNRLRVPIHTLLSSVDESLCGRIFLACIMCGLLRLSAQPLSLF